MQEQSKIDKKELARWQKNAQRQPNQISENDRIQFGLTEVTITDQQTADEGLNPSRQQGRDSATWKKENPNPTGTADEARDEATQVPSWSTRRPGTS